MNDNKNGQGGIAAQHWQWVAHGGCVSFALHVAFSTQQQQIRLLVALPRTTIFRLPYWLNEIRTRRKDILQHEFAVGKETFYRGRGRARERYQGASTETDQSSGQKSKGTQKRKRLRERRLRRRRRPLRKKVAKKSRNMKTTLKHLLPTTTTTTLFILFRR